MGVNAQTAVPAFTAGQVLTAAEMTQVNTGIPVFSTTVTRDAAFGTGKKTLAQGQTCYIEATSTYQTYNGSAWVSLVTAPGLTLIKAQAIGTGVASVTVTNVFSATYDNYRIMVSGGVASATPVALDITLGATATGYYRSGVYVTYNSATVNGLAQQNQTAFAEAFSASTNTINGFLEVSNPFLAKNTHFLRLGSISNTTSYSAFLGGYLANTTSYTDFTLTGNGGTVTGGTIYVYGYANS